ncbi:unnamed protein product [Prorocentrum cordatum]|uniref:Fibronectin type-III domain-containing protein n=1 Tax=Prorocentrum cordatum TaxID=2364126 RepID=A0ABN9QEJ3_9DINO|nr:unnamed protein product [Polarella glacialis]
MHVHFGTPDFQSMQRSTQSAADPFADPPGLAWQIMRYARTLGSGLVGPEAGPPTSGSAQDSATGRVGAGVDEAGQVIAGGSYIDVAQARRPLAARLPVGMAGMTGIVRFLVARVSPAGTDVQPAQRAEAWALLHLELAHSWQSASQPRMLPVQYEDPAEVAGSLATTPSDFALGEPAPPRTMAQVVEAARLRAENAEMRAQLELHGSAEGWASGEEAGWALGRMSGWGRGEASDWASAGSSQILALWLFTLGAESGLALPPAHPPQTQGTPFAAMVAKTPPCTAQCAASAAAAELEGAEVGSSAASAELTELSEGTYLGVVKSYNDRRGFGFVACAELVALHGRDVYLPKAEAALAAVAGPVGEGMAEDDVLQFRVRLSPEGYPQAAEARRLQKLRGTVVRAPRPAGPGGLACAGMVRSRGMAEALGTDSVAVGAEAVGQLRLDEGDEVSFCVPGARDETPPELHDAVLHCHAFADRVLVVGRRPILGPARGGVQIPSPQVAGLPADVTEAELFHFFSKQGATSVALARAAGGEGFAVARFPGIGAVSRLLSSRVHAFADDAETRVATLLPGAPVADQPLLPALPKPLLTAGQDPGTLLITWSPSVIAAGYTLEIRPAGAQAPWEAIDDVTRSTQRPEPEKAPTAVSAAAFPPQAVSGLAQPCTPALGWQQCAHGGLVSAPPVPEVSWADGAGSSVLVRWLPAAHAAAYVVELSELGSSSSERFVRAAAPPGCLVDLQVGGLRQLAPGGSYAARVLCVGACGCESAPSAVAWAPAWAPPAWAPPAWAPPAWALPAWAPPGWAAGPGADGLPRLLHSLGGPAPALAAEPPPGQAALAKPAPSPMVAGPLPEVQASATAGGSVCGPGFRAAGVPAAPGAPMVVGASCLLLD